ncbi:MAG: serine/threonine protein phosphatase [Verrucomicrobia bacterium]|nr:serine/threonine protein phosphatase [Verrucomicrobiota bacterium]
MPITLPPVDRREFIKGSLALGGAAFSISSPVKAFGESVRFDPNRVALLADTHISDDPKRSYPGTKWPGSPVKEEEHEWVNMADSLAQSARQVIGLNPRPANLIINGDCALSRGTEAEYKEFLRLIEPIRKAGITVHITIGNHDTREKLWKLLPFLKKEQMGIHADVIELSYANIFLLDSGKKGILGEIQLDWLAQQLDKHTDRPALVFAHFNPLPNRGVRPIRGMRDGEALLKVLAKRKHVRAYIHGHTHEWQNSKYEEHLHIIGQPAVSYYFGKGHAHGWIDMKLTD